MTTPSDDPLAGTEAARKSMRQRMLDGDLYRAEGPELAEAHHRAMELQARYNATAATDADGRRQLLEELLGEVGEDVVVRPPLYVDYGERLSIGAGTFVNFNLTALDVAPISIGRDCQIATDVQLLTAEHPLDPDTRRRGWESARPIVLGDNVWLGGGVIVLPGVSIGGNTVVGAGSVVTRDLPANTVAVGSPARVVRTLEA